MYRKAAILMLVSQIGLSIQLCEECKCCFGDNSCDIDKNCTSGCIDGYWGNKCTEPCLDNCKTCVNGAQCVKCKPGYWGVSCTKPCLENCQSCVSSTHCADCKPGFWGSKCIEQCPTFCKTCTNRLECTECSLGHWGTQCWSICGIGCVNYTCSTTGQCECKSDNFMEGYCSYCNPGFHGIICDLRCPSNCDSSCTYNGQCSTCNNDEYYGDTCQFNCSIGCAGGKCNKEDGNCKGGCTRGFVGLKCDSCAPGKHGENCDLDCPDNCAACLSNSNCTNCKLGYYGRSCTNLCPEGCDEGICDSNGMCTYECKAEPHTAFNCKACIPGKWGDFCQYKCPDTCPLCTSHNGCIKCPDGFYGPDCDKECPSFCLDSICKLDGECSACNKGHYGVHCQLQCSSLCLNGNCSMLTGRCYECPQGFSGDLCDTVACKGNDGHKCLTPKEQNQHYGHNTPEVIGISLGTGMIGLFIGLAVTFTFIVWKRRKQQSGNERTTLTENGIENISVHDANCQNDLPVTYEELKGADERAYSQLAPN